MRSQMVRSGLRFISSGIICVIVATFFSGQVSRWLFLGMADDIRISFLGLLLGGMCGAWGVIMTATGLLQSGAQERRVSLVPTVLLLFSLITLFFVLAYTSFTSPAGPPQLQPGESINI